MRRVYNPGPVTHQKKFKRDRYKANPIKMKMKGTIMDVWESRSERGQFEMLIDWHDNTSSIELTDVRLRVGATITL